MKAQLLKKFMNEQDSQVYMAYSFDWKQTGQ